MLKITHLNLLVIADIFIKSSFKKPKHFSSTFKGSAKLEKAEILQMTVDHLKMLHASGGKGKSVMILMFDL